MDHATTFARHLARLVRLLLETPDNVDEQKATLRALVLASREGPATLAADDGRLRANGIEISRAFSGVTELLARLATHEIRELVAHAAASPADLLGALRLLAAAPEPIPVDERLRATGATTVRLTPLAEPGTLDGFELVAEEEAVAPVREAAFKPPTGEIVIGAPTSSGPVGGMFDQFATASAAASPELLLTALDQATDGQAVLDALDRIVQAAEHALREGRTLALASFLGGVVTREAGLDAERRRGYGMAIRRIGTEQALGMVAALLPTRAAMREQLHAVLVRAGDEGAAAVIDQLTQAQTSEDRRVYFDVLIALQAGIPALVHMLGDPRWYVVRNAAELLGEMGAKSAARPLAKLVHHADERVRRTALESLLKLDMPETREAVHTALASDSAAVRQQVALALGTRRDADAAVTLIGALDRETDEGVQRALLTSLGQVGTPDAVERLTRMAEPASGIFRRKPVPLRVAATLALGEGRSQPALDALRVLADDKEKPVRDAAMRAIAQARRGSGDVRVTGAFDSIPG